MAATASNVQLKQPPTDGVTSVTFSPTSPSMLLVSSWDTGVRLYDVELNSLRYYQTHKAAVLDAAFYNDDTHVFSVGLAQSLWLNDLASCSHQELGAHDKAIRCVEFSRAHQCAITGSWDQTVQAWDPRASGGKAVESVDVPDRVYTMALHDGSHMLIVGTAERHVMVFDMRSLGKGPVQKRMSPLKFQTRCVRAVNDGSGFAIASIDGRVGMEYMDQSKKGYAFRCHRKKDKGTGLEQVYPVNALAFNPVHGTFATGGCDGTVATWDGVSKKKLGVISGFPTSVAALSFNKDGTLLAIASSYTYESGEKEHPDDSIIIRTLSAKEILPKAKK